MNRNKYRNFAIVVLFLLNIYEINTIFLDEYSVIQDIYSDSDDIVILTPNSTDQIYEQSHSWLIQFYKSPCFTCLHFAMIWKNFAHILNHEWGFDLVRLAVMDCTENNDICVNITTISSMGSPILQYFHEEYPSNVNTLGLAFAVDSNLNSLQNMLTQQIICEQNEGNAKHFPDIKPYNGSSVLNLLTESPNTTRHILILVINVGESTGPQTILDLYYLWPEIVVKYVYPQNKPIMKLLKVKQVPTTIVLNPKNRTYKRHHEYSRDFINKLVRGLMQGNTKFIDKFSGLFESNIVKFAGNRKDILSKIDQLQDPLFFMDLETAIRWSLKIEITSIEIIEKESYDALLDYLSTLITYFPFELKGRAFLAELRDILIIAQDKITGNEFINSYLYIETYYDDVFVIQEDFIACHRNGLQSEMYTCALWKLFHYLTVKAAAVKDSYYTHPEELIFTLQNYVRHFIKCNDCPQDSLRVILEVNATKIDSFDSAVIWLWSAHNIANERQYKEKKGLEFPKIQFPSVDNCPKCKDFSDKWNETEVLNYVKMAYSSEGIKVVQENVEVENVTLQDSTTHSEDSIDMLSFLDVCLRIVSFLVLFSLVFLVFRFRLFKKRTNRKI